MNNVGLYSLLLQTAQGIIKNGEQITKIFYQRQYTNYNH